MICRLFVILSILIFTGCASFPHRVPMRDQNIKNVVAGSTLACAAEAQRTSVFLGLASGSLMALSGAVGVLSAASKPQSTLSPPNPTSEGQEVLPIVASIGLGGLGVGASIGSIIFQITATQYTERAGEILVGTEKLGGCESRPLPKHLLAPKRKKRIKRNKREQIRSKDVSDQTKKPVPTSTNSEDGNRRVLNPDR